MPLRRELPLEWTFSCIHPCGTLQCGQCIKRHERREAFRLIGADDPAVYAESRRVAEVRKD